MSCFFSHLSAVFLYSLCTEAGAWLTQQKPVTRPTCAKNLSHTQLTLIHVPCGPWWHLEPWLFPRLSSRNQHDWLNPAPSTGCGFLLPASTWHASNTLCLGQQTKYPTEANNQHLRRPDCWQQPVSDGKAPTIKGSHSCRGEFEASLPARVLRGAFSKQLGSIRPWKQSLTESHLQAFAF